MISVKADVNEALEFFDKLEVNKKAITKNLLRTVGTGAKQAVKKSFSQYLHKRSGLLYRSVTSRVAKDGKGVLISNNADSGKPTSKDGRNARYGFMLASGYTITPKHKKYLTFRINGQWIRKYMITVKPFDWVEPPVVRYVDSGTAKERLDKALQKQIDYWDKRTGGGLKSGNGT